MFSMITNIYNKKTKGPALMELFTATVSFFGGRGQLEVFDVCTTGDTAHYSSCCHTSNISSCQKKKTFSVFLWL